MHADSFLGRDEANSKNTCKSSCFYKTPCEDVRVTRNYTAGAVTNGRATALSNIRAEVDRISLHGIARYDMVIVMTIERHISELFFHPSPI